MNEKLQNLISARASQILLISIISMLLCQVVKFVMFSIRDRKPMWRLLISTGGFPSSHSALCVSLCITLGMFQWHDLGGRLDWSFAVAVIFTIVIVHDAMGVRYEASKHARILNNLAVDMSEEEKEKLGYGKKGELKEMLGHKWFEVLGGILVGIIVGLIGYFIFV